MFCRRWRGVVVAVVTFSAGLFGAFGQAPSAVANNNFPTLDAIIAKAKEGSTRDQTRLGDYCLSKGDFTNAVIWYRLAAEQGEVEAMLSLASCYSKGQGVAKDGQESARWRQAATYVARKAPERPQAGNATNCVGKEVASRPVPSAAGETCQENRSRCRRVKTLERVEPEVLQITPVIRPVSFQ